MGLGLSLGVAVAGPAAEELPVNPFGIDDPLIGQPAPPLEVEEWFNSQGFSLEYLRGKVNKIQLVKAVNERRRR